MRRVAASIAFVASLVGTGLASPSRSEAESQTARPDALVSTPKEEMTGFRRFNHEWIMPWASFVIPGWGQWGNGESGRGFAFLGTYALGFFIFVANDPENLDADRLPRTQSAQWAELGLQLAGDTGFLSAYDSFRLSLPKLQPGGHYTFLHEPPSLSKNFVAPVKFGFLKNKRTWIPLLIPVGLVVAAAIDSRDTDKLPFHWNDAVYAGGASYLAGVSEEAFFRGYLYPLFNELMHERTWLANISQALLFGLAHLGTVEVPIAQGVAGWYFGWVTQTDDWDIQQVTFQHVWWDAILFTGALLLDDGSDTRVSITLPTLRF